MHILVCKFIVMLLYHQDKYLVQVTFDFPVAARKQPTPLSSSHQDWHMFRISLSLLGTQRSLTLLITARNVASTPISGLGSQDGLERERSESVTLRGRDPTSRGARLHHGRNISRLDFHSLMHCPTFQLQRDIGASSRPLKMFKQPREMNLLFLQILHGTCWALNFQISVTTLYSKIIYAGAQKLRLIPNRFD